MSSAAGRVSLALAADGVTAGGDGDDCGSGGGCGSDLGGLSVAATAGGAGSATAAGLSAAVVALSATAADFPTTERVGFSGGLRKELTKAHPPAIQIAMVKTTPAARAAFCRVLRRGGEDGSLARDDASRSVGIEMRALLQILSRGGYSYPAHWKSVRGFVTLISKRASIAKILRKAQVFLELVSPTPQNRIFARQAITTPDLIPQQQTVGGKNSTNGVPWLGGRSAILAIAGGATPARSVPISLAEGSEDGRNS